MVEVSEGGSWSMRAKERGASKKEACSEIAISTHPSLRVILHWELAVVRVGPLMQKIYRHAQNQSTPLQRTMRPEQNVSRKLALQCGSTFRR